MSRMKCLEDCGELSTGRIANEIRTAIRATIFIEEQLDAVFGFGSFFRGEPFREIDVLAVTSHANTELLPTYYLLMSALEPISARAGCPVHLVMFTPDEFGTKPLRDMHALQLLWATSQVTL